MARAVERQGPPVRVQGSQGAHSVAASLSARLEAAQSFDTALQRLNNTQDAEALSGVGRSWWTGRQVKELRHPGRGP